MNNHLYILLGCLAALGLAAVICAVFWPFWKKKKPLLAVLRFGKIGNPYANSHQKSEYLSVPELEKKLDLLRQLGCQTVLPEDLTAALQGVILPPRPVILVFEYGLQSFFKTVFPLLQARSMKAAVCLCTEHIGQYNAWQDPEKDPWQNTLTPEEISILKKSKLVSFVSQGFSYENLNEKKPARAQFEAQESKIRLENLHHVKTCSFMYPLQPPTQETEKAIRAAGYTITFSPQTGTTPLPANTSQPLRTLPAAKLSRLRLKSYLLRG